MRITINRIRGSLAHKAGSDQAVFRPDGEFSAGVRRSEAVSLGHPVIPVLDGFVG
jgi:hypothetical protein